MIGSDSPKRVINCIHIEDDSCTHDRIAIGFFQPTCRLLIENKCMYVERHEPKPSVGKTGTNILFRWFV